MKHFKLTAMALAIGLAFGGVVPSRAQTTGEAASPPAMKIYTLDCGLTEFKNAAVFSDTGEYDGKPLALPTPCYLIQHGRDWMLWDTGLGDQLAALPNGVEKFGGHFTVRRTLVSQLAQLGLKPDDIHYVGLSHIHFDHAGNLGLFPNATFIIPAIELAAARSKPTPFGVDTAQIAPLDQANIIPADGDYDVFGDGSVVTLKTPGHTPGHHSLMVKLPKAGVVLITGDLYHTRLNYQKGLVLRINDRPNTIASMDRFTRLQVNTHARVVIQHSPEDFAGMPIFPKFLD
ncbi:N-acyl homoserine lactonase family protein [Sphingomonas sp. OK281]|uniref:N-acyl homoserine lactonase family protein n=1 Tax=Sphingomonas sp. OK281 TaxID=1881067 RepID=UPI0008E90369|nr:N-acyl homoserine lactonase family protein [Sphingomonas sp. OK281]SFO33357.1 Metallo-beta-lactamase superfamily protein [Sphingomonas sp. OK281]